jgi:putative oxidoreductase
MAQTQSSSATGVSQLGSQSTQSSSTSTAPIVLLGRFFFVLIFLLAAPGHFSRQTIGYAASQGVPLASIAVPISGILAILGALSILLGYKPRIGAWLIVLFLAGVTPMLHRFWGVADPMAHQMQFIHFMKNLSMMGGALLISQFGTGPWSITKEERSA